MLEPLSPDVRRALQVSFEHGRRLVQQDVCDFDAAHKLFAECVCRDPGNLLYVEALLQNLEARTQATGRRRTWRGWLGLGAAKLRKAAAADDPLQVLDCGPDALHAGPHDPQTLVPLAEACRKLRLHDSELRYLHAALSANPDNPAVLRAAGVGFSLQGRFDAARGCWERLQAMGADDQQTARFLELLPPAEDGPSPQAGDASGTAVAAAGGPAVANEAAGDQNLDQNLEQNLARNLDPKLAEIDSDIDAGRFDAAERTLRRLAAAAPGDWGLRERLEDLEIARKRRQVAVAEALEKAFPSPLASELVDRQKADLNRMEIALYDSRAQRYPTETRYRRALALRLLQAEMYAEAEPLLAAWADADDGGPETLCQWGECLQQLRRFEPALAAYERAIAAAEAVEPESPSADNRPDAPCVAAGEAASPPPLIRAHYRRGVLAAALGDARAAEHSLETVVAHAPDFKDAAARLDNLRRIRHKM